LLLFALLLWLSLAFAGAASAQSGGGSGPQKTERIEAELVPMSAWAAPGSTAVVAVRQKIQPGWHTYWRNPGDSGGPTTLNWTLPQGVAAGEVVWPLPQRQRLQGLTNFGYEGEVFLPVPIEIPASARPGTTASLSVRATFLVCSAEMCVPDQMTLALALPIRDGAAPLSGAVGRRIQSVVETAPRPAGITARVILDEATLSLSAAGGPLTGLTPKQASFFPYEGSVIDHAAAQFGQRGPQGLTLTLAANRDLKTLTGPIRGVLSTDVGSWEITATPGTALPGAMGAGSLEPTPDAFGQAEAPAKTGWPEVLKAAGFAFLGGLILNLMPCVFPVLAMKAASLTRSAHAPAEARRDGIAFTLGVLVSFAVLAAILLILRAGGQAVGWGFQLQSPAVVAALAVLMLAVALNLSGVFEVGARLQAVGGSGAGARLSRLPGGTGAFFTGVLAVVVAAPCTAPFMAFALGAALVMPAPLALIVFLMLGLGLALPYLAVSLSPGLLSKLPKPGRWMVVLQRGLALPMYAAALWLVWVFWRQTDLSPTLLLLAACVAAAVGLAAVGIFAHRARWARGLGWGALAVAVTLTGVSGHLAASAKTPAELPADAWSEAKVQAALASGRPVLVNFTADWCVSCKINERTALSSPVTARALREANTLYLEGDWTRRDDAITRELERHGRSGVPLYLVYKPGKAEPEVLPQLLTDGVVVEALRSE
jgi:thiol:disulfide interchange protein/DsbC/DsbD-like thiol-disulfide interchange protein